MHRRVAGAFALLLTTAACGGGHANHLERASGTTTSSAPSTTTTQAPTTTAAPVAAAPAGPPRTAAPPRPASTAPPATSAGGGGPNLAGINVRLTQVAALQRPVAMAVRNGDPTLYVAQKTGQVMAVRGGGAATVLDLSGGVAQGGEQGLLGVAISRDGALMVINYTDLSGNTNVVTYAMGPAGPDPATAHTILFVQQPFNNHNGGNVVFGPDGALWIGLGDGGNEGDPNNTAQNPGTVLGKMLRLDRNGGQPQIWALGFRNPWRYSFDRANGDLWIGDVGQNTWEEIDHAPAGQGPGANYGWSRFEGNHLYKPSEPAPNAIPPVSEYSHNGGGCSVTAGYVYRGPRIPAMNGAFLFGDYCLGHVMAFNGGQVRDLGLVAKALSSFGEDQTGELYVLSLNGPVYRIDPA